MHYITLFVEFSFLLGEKLKCNAKFISVNFIKKLVNGSRFDK